MVVGSSRIVLLLAFFAAVPAFAGIADTPLPQFADGKASVAVAAVSGVVKRLRLQTEALCTSRDSVAVNIGLEVFDASGALLNDVSAGVGAILNVAPGATVTIGTSATAGFLETVTIPLADVTQGSARALATSAQVQCVFMIVDDAVTPPVTVGTLGRALQPEAGSGLAGVGMPTFADAQAATHALLIPGVVKRGRMETDIFCTSLAAAPIDIGVQVFGPDGVLRNDVGAGNGALLGVAPGATVTFGTTGTLAYLEDAVIVLAGVAQGMARVVSTSGEVMCAAQVLDAAVTPPLAMSALAVVQSAASGTPLPTNTPTLAPTATPTPTNTVNPASSCDLTPRSCANAGKSIAILKSGSGDPAKRAVSFKWLKGSVASKADFGDPTATTSYALCVYENGQRVLSSGLDGGGTCAAGPCWKAISDKGYRYKNAAGNSAGIAKLILKAGTGKAKIILKGKGAGVAVPAADPLFAAGATVTVQLVRTDGSQCWQGSFSPPAVTSTGAQFKDQAP